MLNSKIRPGAVVGYGVKIFHPSPPNYVTRSPGEVSILLQLQINVKFNCKSRSSCLFRHLVFIEHARRMTCSGTTKTVLLLQNLEIAPCKVIQESLGFHVCGFQIPHPWIPDSITNNLDSRLQLWLDSGSH